MRKTGNFDLDPDRTLDIILDTFSDQLVHHHQFFLDFLSISPWAPKVKSTGSAAEGEMEVDGAESSSKEWVDVGLDKDQGRSSMAQILGFKFGYYQVCPLRCCLLSPNFVSSHLRPSES